MKENVDRLTRSRRAVLCATGSVTLLAGCLGDNVSIGSGGDDTAGTDDDNGETDDSDDDNGESEGSGNTGDEGERYETQPVSHTEVPVDPDVELHTTAESASEWLADRGIDDDGPTEFVADTDFAESVVVSLEADGPNLCSVLAIETVTVDSEIEIRTRVADDADDEEACGEMEIGVGQLVRARPTEDTPGVTATIVDRDGAERGFGVAADTDEATAPERSDDTAESGSETGG